jgi:LysR family transcriptional regulator, cell division regulator
MDPADLRVFAAVARLGSMRGAADDLNTVQSNVTARIRSLEVEIGVPLFERHSRGVTLTAAGQRLLPFVAKVSTLLREAAQATRDDGVPKGPLVIGALETTTALRLSPILANYARAHPQVDMVLRTGTSCELIARVLDHDIEGAFVVGPVHHPELVEDHVFREELAIMTAPEVRTLDTALGSNSVKIVVLRLGCSYRQRLEELLMRRGIVGLRTLEFGTIEAIFGCVAAGLGITLLPRALLGPVWQDGRVHVHALPPEEAHVETVFVRRRDGHASSALSAFLDCARTVPAQAIAAE